MKLKITLPSVYTILFLLIILVAALTWIIPAGQYKMVNNELLGKLVPVSGSYHQVESSPQSFTDILLAPIKGFYDPVTNQARAIDVALFVLIIGGFFGVVNKTKAIESGIFQITKKLKGREIWMIPTLMGFFALGGTIFGMAEETLPFYTLVIPVMIAAGYDSITGVAVVMIGAGVGALGSTVNPFATIIASNAAQVSFTDGLALRIVILILAWLLCVVYVMRYAKKIKENPELSLVANHKLANEKYFLHHSISTTDKSLSIQQKLVLTVLLLVFVVMVIGVSYSNWWMAEISALFIAATLVVAVVAKINEQTLTVSFIDGAKELLGVAFIITLARGLVVVMDEGNITHTFLFYAENLLSDLSPIVFINAIYGVESFLSLLIPSSSGLAVLSMPVLAPLADFSNVPRELVVTAYQAASGLPNLVTPTSAIVMGGLALGRVSYSTWLKFIAPLLAMIILLVMIMLSVGVVLS
ncbi:YfcC family protein [Colwellia sp. 12G3]|uniref:YfcC family protein n=1 Tax=Colwellia sp. 12G3 TaxID=2058299 RepID=UPI000C33390D|nr:YfcC family protein [Colwellia sp. 12G3]PKI17867.1 C4-dicarboxylate ABC transporter [Colwellia sp. 12G3]